MIIEYIIWLPLYLFQNVGFANQLNLNVISRRQGKHVRLVSPYYLCQGVYGFTFGC